MSEQSFALHRHRHGGFVQRVLGDILAIMEHAIDCENFAQQRGFMQFFDPRVRLLFCLSMIGLTVFSRHILLIVILFAYMLMITLCSKIPLIILVRGIWPSVLFFTGMLALPAIFLVPGEVVFRLPFLAWPITSQGIHSATLLVFRALTSASFAALLILSTPWPHLLKALRILGMPLVMVAIISMTYRYIFVLLQTVQEQFIALQSRQVGNFSKQESRRLVVAGAGALMNKSLQLSEEVYLAMQSRGYRGEHFILTSMKMRSHDWLACGILLVGLISMVLTLWK
jgi:cobalt/nickel transport system permease protein